MPRTVHTRRLPDHIEGRIAALLERLSMALRVLMWGVAHKEGLSPIQIQFLLYIHTRPSPHCTVSALAREFSLTRPTVSDAVAALAEKGLIVKTTSRKDRRISTLRTTAVGNRTVKRLSRWKEGIMDLLEPFPHETKESAMVFMMSLIKSLQDAGVIVAIRMCITCDNFRRDAHLFSDRPHHCALTDSPIGAGDLRVDCPNHTHVTVHAA